MRLTVYTDYSLRLMMYLAVKYPQGTVATIDEIATAYDISRAHLMKIVHELGQHGFIETIRGRAGGMRLARPPREISVGDVVRMTESDFAVVPCHDPEFDGNCVILPACNLKRVLRRALDAFMQELDKVTIQDTVTHSDLAASLLRLNSRVAIPVVVASKLQRSRKPSKGQS